MKTRLLVPFAFALALAPASAVAAQPWDLVPDAPRHVDRFGRVLQDMCASEPGRARCAGHWIVSGPTPSVTSDGGPGLDGGPTLPLGLGPSQIASAYGLTSAPPSGGAIVAVVNAYGDSSALTDVNVYRATYGLPAMTACASAPVTGGPACLWVVNQTGATSPLPADMTGWSGGSSLYLEMISATCPDCSIVLVEANSAADTDLNPAVNAAAAVPGVVAISTSYVGFETNEANNTAYNHPGILVLGAAGDNDYMNEGWSSSNQPVGVASPASFPGVLAVGGTILEQTNSGTRGFEERVWNDGDAGGAAMGTASGCSTVFAQPSWQNGLTGSCKMRADNDVSAAADFMDSSGAQNGIATYCTACTGGTAGTFVSVFSTGAATPMVAGIMARLKLATTIGSNPGWVYAHASSFYDVTSGFNDVNDACGTNVLSHAGCGWDGPTGVGTPSGVDLLAGTNANGPCTSSGSSGGSDAGCGSGSSSGSSSGGSSGSSSGSGSGSGGDASASSSGSSSGGVGGAGVDAATDAEMDGSEGEGGGPGAKTVAGGNNGGCGCITGAGDGASNLALLFLAGAGLLLVSGRRRSRRD